MKVLSENSRIVSKGFLNDSFSQVSWTRKVLTHRQKETWGKNQMWVCLMKNSSLAKSCILTSLSVLPLFIAARLCLTSSWFLILLKAQWDKLGLKGAGWSLCCYPGTRGHYPFCNIPVWKAFLSLDSAKHLSTCWTQSNQDRTRSGLSLHQPLQNSLQKYIMKSYGLPHVKVLTWKKNKPHP